MVAVVNAATSWSVTFDASTPIGQIVMFKGQRYELTGHRPYVRRDGEESTLLVWSTHCARCGDPMEIATWTGARWPNRRCTRHRRPGSAA